MNIFVVMPALVAGIHAAPLRKRAEACPPLCRSRVSPLGVGGRDEPGHDGFSP